MRGVKCTSLEPGKKYASIPLKGKALIAAIEAGMVPVASNGDGWNIAPFMKFWELFRPNLDEAFEAFHQQRVMVEKKRDCRSNQDE